jgi:PAN domain
MSIRLKARLSGVTLAIMICSGGVGAEPRLVAQNDPGSRLDEKLKDVDPCAEKLKGLKAAGFKLKCDTLIPFGALLGATPVSQTASDLGDCAARCRKEPKCVAFSYDAGAKGPNHSCYLTGSIPSYNEAKNWIAGTR